MRSRGRNSEENSSLAEVKDLGQKADIGIRMVRYCPVEGMSVSMNIGAGKQGTDCMEARKCRNLLLLVR